MHIVLLVLANGGVGVDLKGGGQTEGCFYSVTKSEERKVEGQDKLSKLTRLLSHLIYLTLYI